MSKKTLAHVALFFVALIYGANYSIAKIAMDEVSISPMSMIFMRGLIGGVLFTVVYFLFIREKILLSDIPLFILCALTGVSINMSLFFIGLNYTNPINASLVMTTSPVMVLIFSFMILREKISKVNILGVFTALVGATVLIYRPNISIFNHSIMGDFFVFLNGTSYALYIVLVKSLVKRYHSFTILMMVFSLGFLFIIPFSVQDWLDISWGQLSTEVYLSIAFVLLGTTCMTYFFNAFALNHVKSSTVGSYIYLQPLIASFFAILLEKDQLNFKMILSSMLIFGGLYMVSKKNIEKK